MHFKLRLIPTAVASLLLAACGGGGGGSGLLTSSSSTGTVVDGYLNFAKVVCDVNENGAYDPGEPVTFTSNTGDGKFVFRPGCTHSLLGAVDGTGTNADTGLAFVGLLRAPAGATVITPLTTLLAAGLTPLQITTALHLPEGTNLFTVDPAATNADGSLKDATLLKTTLAVQQLLQKTTEVVNGLAGMSGSVSTAAVYTLVANALATTLKTGAVLVDTTGTIDSAVVSDMLTLALTSIANASSIDAAVKDALVDSGGAATLPVVMAEALTSQAQEVLSAPEATLTATVLDRQSNTAITDTLKAAVVSGDLTASTAPADLATLGATTTAEAEKPTSTGGTLPGVLATFDEVPPLVFAGFNGAEGSSIQAGPNGGSGKALNVLRTGGEVWAGAEVTVGAMDVSSTNTTVTARVYSPLAGIPIVLKLEGATQAITTGEIQATETVVTGWQTLSWIVPTAKISTAYTKVVLLPNLGTKASVDPGESYFFDDIKLGAAIAAPPVAPTNYLYLKSDAIGFSADGTSNSVSYSMAAFQSTGINIKWPMANGAALKLNLAENGTFNIANGQTLSAAVQIEDMATSGQIRAYTDGVTVSKSGSSITLSVPNLPQALIYGVSGNGNTKAVINFASKVQGISNVLSTATSALSTVMFGEVVNFGITELSNQFTGITGLRGKYKVTIVVNQLPLRKADGTVFDTTSIQMPTSVSNGVESNIVPVTGSGLVGYINLVD